MKSTDHIRDLWPGDPRAAFEIAMGDDALWPNRIAARLLEARVLPFTENPPIYNKDHEMVDFLIAEGITSHPNLDTRWHFHIEGRGWLDAWDLLTKIRHEEYVVMLLLGLGVPLDRVAGAMASVGGRSAWGALGAVGWIQMYANSPERVNLGTRPWLEMMPGVRAVVDQATGPLTDLDWASMDDRVECHLKTLIGLPGFLPPYGSQGLYPLPEEVMKEAENGQLLDLVSLWLTRNGASHLETCAAALRLLEAGIELRGFGVPRLWLAALQDNLSHSIPWHDYLAIRCLVKTGDTDTIRSVQWYRRVRDVVEDPQRLAELGADANLVNALYHEKQTFRENVVEWIASRLGVHVAGVHEWCCY